MGRSIPKLSRDISLTSREKTLDALIPLVVNSASDMKRNIALAKRYPAFYRHDLMNERRKELGLTVRQVWQKSGMKENSTRRVFKGTASSKQAYPLAQFLSMDWSLLHDFGIPKSEFRRAVLNGDSRSGR